MDGLDFRLAAISFAGLVSAAIALVIAVVTREGLPYLIGAGLTVVSFVVLVAALSWTVWASFNRLYPG